MFANLLELLYWEPAYMPMPRDCLSQRRQVSLRGAKHESRHFVLSTDADEFTNIQVYNDCYLCFDVLRFPVTMNYSEPLSG